jgi:hypothetical protein
MHVECYFSAVATPEELRAIDNILCVMESAGVERLEVEAALATLKAYETKLTLLCCPGCRS